MGGIAAVYGSGRSSMWRRAGLTNALELQRAGARPVSSAWQRLFCHPALSTSPVRRIVYVRESHIPNEGELTAAGFDAALASGSVPAAGPGSRPDLIAMSRMSRHMTFSPARTSR